MAQAEEKSLKTVEDSKELGMSWWITYVKFSLLQFKKDEGEKDEILVEERSLL